MSSLRTLAAFAARAGLVLLAGCSLATSFSGLSGSAADEAGAAGATDGGSSVGPDGSQPSNNDSGTIADSSTTIADWGSVAIVQAKRTTGKPGVDLDQKTNPHTLLVVMCPDPKPPTPAGVTAQWQLLKASYGGAVFIWPDNPGGISHFTIMDANNDLFFLEMSGVPADVRLSNLVDTGPKDGGTTTEALTASATAGAHGIALLYIDTTSGSSAAADMGWTSLGTDTNNDYGWYRLDPIAPFNATVTFSPTTPAQMMMVQVGNGK